MLVCTVTKEGGKWGSPGAALLSTYLTSELFSGASPLSKCSLKHILENADLDFQLVCTKDNMDWGYLPQERLEQRILSISLSRDSLVHLLPWKLYILSSSC